jgi:hypothetical protein
MNYIYYGYVTVALVIAYLIIKGKGNKTFSVAYMASMTVFAIDGLLYLRFCYLGIYDPTPAYHSLTALLLFAFLQWAKMSYNIKLFDRKWR